jgi:hypothetical protein
MSIAVLLLISWFGLSVLVQTRSKLADWLLLHDRLQLLQTWNLFEEPHTCDMHLLVRVCDPFGETGEWSHIVAPTELTWRNGIFNRRMRFDGAMHQLGTELESKNGERAESYDRAEELLIRLAESELVRTPTLLATSQVEGLAFQAAIGASHSDSCTIIWQSVPRMLKKSRGHVNVG